MTETGQRGRIRWGRWIGLSLMAIIVVVLVAHAIWMAVMGSRMNGRIQALQQAGEPILRSDFVEPNADEQRVRDADVVAAVALIDHEADAWLALARAQLELPLNDSDRRNLEAVSEVIRPALLRFVGGAGTEEPGGQADPSTPLVLQKMPAAVGASRSIAFAMGLQSLFDHTQGRDGAAIAGLDRALDLRQPPNRYPSTIGHIVSLGNERQVSSRVIQIAPALRISDSAGDASPAAVRHLIDRLLDDAESKRGLLFSFRGERMVVLETVQYAIDAKANPYSPGTKPNAVTAYLLRPLYYRAGWQAIDAFDQTIVIANGEDWPAIRANLPMIEDWDRFSVTVMTPLHTPIKLHFQARTERHIAAVALAVRWYALDHEGNPPETLSELIPRYLPSVPIDRFSRDTSPLRYKLTADGPLIYSVGDDLVDDGGSAAPINTRRSNPDDWEMKDRVVPLYRRRQSEVAPNGRLSSPPPNRGDRPGVPME